MKTFEAFLENKLASLPTSKVKDAMTYSLLGGGKRVRVDLLLRLYQDFGFEVNETAYSLAAALESIHTYSLIHDDLPALDNDDLRRFKPTNHKVYGEDFAILAGDGLLTFAFQLLSATDLDMRYVRILSQNAGASGMILGQEIDILDAIETLEDLEHCYRLKTGCLFSAALEMATLLAGHEDKLPIVQKIAASLGVAFQVQDDLLEVTKDTLEIGKSNSSDADRDIKTILSFMSIENARIYLDGTFESVYALLDTLPLKGDSLIQLIQTMRVRSL